MGGTQIMVPQPNLLQTDLSAAAGWVQVAKSYSMGGISARLNLRFHLASQCELHLSGSCALEATLPLLGTVSYDPCAEYMPPTTYSNWRGAAYFYTEVQCPGNYCSATFLTLAYGSCAAPTQIV